MITFNFHKIKEKKPKSGKSVVYIKMSDSVFSVGTAIHEGKASYEYYEVDETGTYTGNTFHKLEKNSVEVIWLGNERVSEDTYWCYSNDWWNAFKLDGVKI